MKPSTIRACIALLFLTAPGALAQTIPAREPFRLTVDVARFRGADDNSVMIEVHYAVAQDGLTYRADSAGWSGAGDLTLLVRGKDSLVYGDRWLVPHSAPDTGSVQRGMSLIGIYPLQLPRGEYTVTLIGRDRHLPARLDSVVLRMPVIPVATDRPAISDIEFASTIRTGAKQGPFFKNTLEVVPNVGGLYGEDQKVFFYLEAYNLLLAADRSDYKMRVSIFDAVGKELLTRDRAKKRLGESAVLVDQFSVDALKSGTYALVVSLIDTANRPFAQSARKFFVYNPTLGIDSTLITSSSSLPLAVYASMEDAELDREFQWSRYETTDAERIQFGQLKGIDVKRKFLSDIWRRRPAGAREEYMARVAQVNSSFSTLGREGYKTDRGRVHIVYGAPDDYERHPNEPDMKPYEVWSYHNIQGGVIFVFVQRNQGGDYELVHSTHRNELHDDNWERYAQSR